MRGLILVSHGSLLCGAGHALMEHAERLRLTGDWDVVDIGYMNYSRPDFQESVRRMVESGIRELTIAPYFLIPGKFVTQDLPDQLRAAAAAHPDIRFRLADPVGFDESIATAILELANQSRAPEDWRKDLARASKFCEENPVCPLYATVRCPRTIAHSMDVAG